MSSSSDTRSPAMLRPAELVAAVAIAVSISGMSISLAALIFANELAGGLPRATSAFLIGNGLATALVAVRSRIVPTVSIGQDGPAVVFVAVAANLVARDAGLEAIDVLVVVALATALTGAAMVLGSHVGLGQAVRFLPATVVGGFIAGTGWLLFKGGIEVMVDRHLDLGELSWLFEASTMKLWIPGVAFGVALWGLSVAPRVSTLVPSLVIIGAVATFYLITFAATDLDTVRDGGWLVGPFGDELTARPISPAEIGDVAWATVARELPALVGVALVAVIALMLNLSSLETLQRQQVDVDGELRIAGFANLLQAPVGGTAAFHGIGDTMLARELGASTRLAPALAGIATAGFGLVGIAAIGYVPRFLAGGLLVTIGVGLLVRWVQDLADSNNGVDRVSSIAILGVIATVGILEGIAFGIVVACAVFVIRYSRVDPVRRRLSGSLGRSRVDRSPAHLAELARGASRIQTFELHGYLFFGSVIRVAEQVREVCADAEVEHVILECRRVTGLDTSAARSLRELLDDLTHRGIAVAAAGATEDVLAAIGSVDGVAIHAGVDTALEDAEDHLLVDVTTAVSDGPLSAEWLDQLRHTQVDAGTTVLRSGEPGDQLHYLIEGQVSIYVDGADGARHRLRRFTGPSWLGEIGFLQGDVRTADVVAETDLELASLTRDEWNRLRPEVMTAMLRDIATTQAHRMTTISTALANELG